MLSRFENYNYLRKQWEEHFILEDKSVKIDVICWSACGGRIGFQHRCYVYINNACEVYKNKFYKIQYYNRTWEKYRYQSLLRHVVSSLLKDKVINASQSDQFKKEIENL